MSSDETRAAERLLQHCDWLENEYRIEDHDDQDCLQRIADIRALIAENDRLRRLMNTRNSSTQYDMLDEMEIDILGEMKSKPTKSNGEKVLLHIVNKLQRQIHDLNLTMCAACGARVENSTELRKHLRVCKQHPLQDEVENWKAESDRLCELIHRVTIENDLLRSALQPFAAEHERPAVGGAANAYVRLQTRGHFERAAEVIGGTAGKWVGG